MIGNRSLIICSKLVRWNINRRSGIYYLTYNSRQISSHFVKKNLWKIWKIRKNLCKRKNSGKLKSRICKQSSRKKAMRELELWKIPPLKMLNHKEIYCSRQTCLSILELLLKLAIIMEWSQILMRPSGIVTARRRSQKRE